MIFRKRTPYAYSIEKLFEGLYARLRYDGAPLDKLELPHVSTGIGRVLQNVLFVARRRTTKLLHITGDVHYAALLCPLARTIVTVHDCVVLQRGTGVKGLVMRWLWFDLPLRAASTIVVISDQTKRELMDTVRLPAGKIVVVPNYVDPRFSYANRLFKTEQPRILHVGTTPNKNLLRVIAALRGVRCVLVIVGPLTDLLRALLEEHAIRFENPVGVSDRAMYDLYREADIISFPSIYEGFGMPVLEGQAVGRAVLTSNIEPMRSIAGIGGALLVDPQSVESIAAGFYRLITDAAERTRLIAAGRANAARYSFDAVVDAYLKLYQLEASRVRR